MSEDKKKIEAILFTTGRFLKLDDISRMCGIGSVGYLKTLLNEIKEEYAKRETALDIVEDGGRWKLNIRKEFLHLTEKLLDDAELDLPTQKTLAVVAYKQPAIQCDVVSIRAMIEKVSALIGSGKPQYGVIPYRPGENMALYASISKAKKMLNWEPVISLEEGLLKTIDCLNDKA